jgi:hypothetical protein
VKLLPIINQHHEQESSSGNWKRMNEMDTEVRGVKVVDIDMPFWSMVGFMVQFVIASIPAMIILFLFGVLLFGLFGAIIGFSV